MVSILKGLTGQVIYIHYLCLIFNIGTFAYAHEDSWVTPQDPKIGQWRSGELTLHLTANGQATLDQNGMSFIVESQSKKTSSHVTLQGYWWSDTQRLCLNFDLRSRCVPFQLVTKGKSESLSIKLGLKWVHFTPLKT